MYIYIYILCMYIPTCIYIYIYFSLSLFYTYTHTYVRTYIYIYIYLSIYIYIYIYIYSYQGPGLFFLVVALAACLPAPGGADEVLSLLSLLLQVLPILLLVLLQLKLLLLASILYYLVLLLLIIITIIIMISKSFREVACSGRWSTLRRRLFQVYYIYIYIYTHDVYTHVECSSLGSLPNLRNLRKTYGFEFWGGMLFAGFPFKSHKYKTYQTNTRFLMQGSVWLVCLGFCKVLHIHSLPNIGSIL